MIPVPPIRATPKGSIISAKKPMTTSPIFRPQQSNSPQITCPSSVFMRMPSSPVICAAQPGGSSPTHRDKKDYRCQTELAVRQDERCAHTIFLLTAHQTRKHQ